MPGQWGPKRIDQWGPKTWQQGTDGDVESGFLLTVLCVANDSPLKDQCKVDGRMHSQIHFLGVLSVLLSTWNHASQRLLIYCQLGWYTHNQIRTSDACL